MKIGSEGKTLILTPDSSSVCTTGQDCIECRIVTRAVISVA